MFAGDLFGKEKEGTWGECPGSESNSGVGMGAPGYPWLQERSLGTERWGRRVSGHWLVSTVCDPGPPEHSKKGVLESWRQLAFLFQKIRVSESAGGPEPTQVPTGESPGPEERAGLSQGLRKRGSFRPRRVFAWHCPLGKVAGGPLEACAERRPPHPGQFRRKPLRI